MPPSLNTLAVEPASQECVPQSYEELIADATLLGIEIGVSDEIYNVTLELVGELRDFNEQSAIESLQGLRLAIAEVNTIIEVCEIGPERAAKLREATWSGFTLHDIGKGALPEWLILKSNAGTEKWTDEDRELMRAHPTLGYYIARDRGLPMIIARPIAEHHGKQIFSAEYGMNPELSDDERIVCDAIRIADTADAAIKRTNTRNKDMGSGEKWAEVQENTNYVFGDYRDRREELVARVLIEARRQLDAETEMADAA